MSDAVAKMLSEGWRIEYSPATFFVEGKHPRGGECSIVEVHRSLSVWADKDRHAIGYRIAEMLNNETGDAK